MHIRRMSPLSMPRINGVSNCVTRAIERGPRRFQSGLGNPANNIRQLAWEALMAWREGPLFGAIQAPPCEGVQQNGF